MPHPIFVALWLLGIVPVYLLLRSDDPLPRWLCVPLALLWPPVIYVAMFILAIDEATERRKARRG